MRPQSPTPSPGRGRPYEDPGSEWSTPLAAFIAARRVDNSARWIAENIDRLLRDWIGESRPTTVLEVGGGRSPLLSEADLAGSSVITYVVNDRSADELERIPNSYRKACFDIQSQPDLSDSYVGQCDLVFSRMVFEHVPDPRAAWATTHALLRPGGQTLAFVPTLYALPFVVNRLLPDGLSARLLSHFAPNRNPDETPKFPAYYRWCRARHQYLADRLLPLGFRTVDVIPFYGHNYFDRIPILRRFDAALTHASMRRDWRVVASFALIIGQT